jgi:hypothetical protein
MYSFITSLFNIDNYFSIFLIRELCTNNVAVRWNQTNIAMIIYTFVQDPVAVFACCRFLI